jgi:hypothetical protein
MTKYMTMHTPEGRVYLAPLVGPTLEEAITQALRDTSGYTGNGALAQGTFYIHHGMYGKQGAGDGPYNCKDYYREP